MQVLLRLILSLKDRKVDLWTQTAMTDLIAENGSVIGIKATKNDVKLILKLTKVSFLHLVGLKKIKSLRDEYLPKPTNIEWSAANTYNTGDALKAALKLRG